MDEGSLGLKRSPGLGIATLERYVPLETRESMVRDIAKTIQRGLGPCTVIGGIGSGKSLLAQRIAQLLHPHFSLVLLHGSTLRSAGKLHECLVSELDIAVESKASPGIRAAVQQFLLTKPSSDGAGMLILVDDAQWCSRRVFEELLLMGDWTDGRTPRVRYVLLGTPHLEHVLLQPRLQSLHHRIALRSFLPFYRAEESREVILTKIRMSGGDALQLLSEEAIRSIHHLTQGNPRWIDYLLDFSLRLAIDENSRRIEPPLVERAWAALQGLHQADDHQFSQNLTVESGSGEWIEFIELNQTQSDSGASDKEQTSITPRSTSAPIIDGDPTPYGGQKSDAVQDHSDSPERNEMSSAAMAEVASVPTNQFATGLPEERHPERAVMVFDRGDEGHPSPLHRFLSAWRRESGPQDEIKSNQAADDRFRILEISSSENR
jgi:type II secretory pathway predicted ATPase ExeA